MITKAPGQGYCQKAPAIALLCALGMSCACPAPLSLCDLLKSAEAQGGLCQQSYSYSRTSSEDLRITARYRASNLVVIQLDTTHLVPPDQVVVCAGERTRSFSNAAKPVAGAGRGSEQQERRDAGAPRPPIALEFCLSPALERQTGEADQRPAGTAAWGRKDPRRTLCSARHRPGVRHEPVDPGTLTTNTRQT